ncbi:sperm-associated antigen 5 [Sorex araneus]|uniref:sperm-associated antigen 5 n=1 Tax=Sorex araneus TaxID=42254 RepID=UPI002433B703|nr:sperm-associated antigen 5 [Sorex araneus]
MWRVKKLNMSVSPSGKPAGRTPLRELMLQPSALTSSGKKSPTGSSLSPSLCKLGPQEDSKHSSTLDFVNTKRIESPSEPFSHPSEWQEPHQLLSDEPHISQIPQTNSISPVFEEALYNEVIKTMVFVPSAEGGQQDIIHEAHFDSLAETINISLDELLQPGDLLGSGLAPSIEDSFFPEVVSSIAEKPALQDPPSQISECPPSLCSEQQLDSEEKPKSGGADIEPENLVPSGNNVFLPSSTLWLSPSTALAADFPASSEVPGEDTAEHRAMEGKEISFPMLPEAAELGDQALVSDGEDIPCTWLSPQPGNRDSQAAHDPTVEDASRCLISDTEPWLSPLAWLEKGVNTSVMLENLRQSVSRSFPSVLRDAATAMTPVSTCSMGTWFTPPAQQEKSSDTSQAGVVGTKDSASEAEPFLRGHPPDLTALSRRDLEDNLLNSLVILEVLSRQLQEWKSHLTARPAVQDSSTQTDTSGGKPWVQVSKELISLLHLSLLHLEEDKSTVSLESPRAENLVSYFKALKKLRGRLQSLRAEQEQAKHREKTAPSGRDSQAETVLEAFCAHSGQLKQDLAASLLKETQTHLVGLHTEQEQLAQQTASLTQVLHQDWISMQLDYVTWTALLSRSRELTEKLMAKSRQTLQERDTAIEEKEQVSRKLEQVSAHLEDCKSQIEELKLENSRLATDLQTQLQILSSTESQLQELGSQHSHCAQDLAKKDELICQLTQSNEEQAAQWQKEEMELKQIQAELQQQQAVLAKEVQDLKETLEFADQENQVAHLELGQIECQLKATLEVLRERSLQCEDLKDTVENLKAKLANIIAESQEHELEKTRQYSQELGVLTKQLQSLTDFLQTKLQLQEKAEPEPLVINTASAYPLEHPPPTDSTILGSSVAGPADEALESAPGPIPLLGSDKSAFTRVASMVSLQPPETPDLEKSLAEVGASTVALWSLCSLLQESKEEAIRTLQQTICDLQAKLQAQEEQHEEAQKAKEAEIEKLNQALCIRYKNEKELQEVVQQQSKKILEQIDNSGELISLREEVMQLTRSLRHAETETKVLRETLAGQLDPNCQPMATSWIQEKVWLSQEVDKLRMMFLEVKNEKAKLMVKFQSHRNILEENLRRSEKELKKLDDIVQHIYETLCSIPDVVGECKELQELLEFLN